MTGAPQHPSPYLDSPTPLAFAHRGGAKAPGNVGIENTIAAFSASVALGYRYLETDVWKSADDVVYAWHDATLGRLTGSWARIADLTSTQIDAERVGGREPIPRLSELYEAFPTARFNVDVKSDDAVVAACAAVVASGAVDRTCFASFSHSRLMHLRKELPTVATSASTREVAQVKLLHGPLLAALYRPAPICLQVPPRHNGIPLVTPGFLRRAHRLGLQVHVWTIDDRSEINRLLDLGVDGIISDRTDILKETLVARGAWTGDA